MKRIAAILCLVLTAALLCGCMAVSGAEDMIAEIGIVTLSSRNAIETAEKNGIAKTIAVRMCRRGGLEIKETITNAGTEPCVVTVNGNTLLQGKDIPIL